MKIINMKIINTNKEIMKKQLRKIKDKIIGHSKGWPIFLCKLVDKEDQFLYHD